MAPKPYSWKRELPLSPDWNSEDEYVQELLTFATSSILFRHLCGGVHILDFLTSKPDIYTHVLDAEWRHWFDQLDIWDIIQFILHGKEPSPRMYESLPPVPDTLKDYVFKVRSLCLNRDYHSSDYVSDHSHSHHRHPPPMPRHVAVGMKPKKMHEVSNFASFVNDLSDSICERSCGSQQQEQGQQKSQQKAITLVDFGSGQNYLGRTLACPPYNKNVIAIEKKHHNIQGAQGMDVYAKLAKRERIMRNKKEYKRRLTEGICTVEDEMDEVDVPAHVLEQLVLEEEEEQEELSESNEYIVASAKEHGSITYIEHEISDGDLEGVLGQYQSQHHQEPEPDANESRVQTPKLMTISLHSCGNLSHHAIRSLVVNRSVTAIAIVGCCYNLLTERLGPQSYKIPSLRPNHPRLLSTSTTYDPHGFPMSKKLEEFPLPYSEGGKGVRLNITARMMAVQAPYNWGKEDSEMFFRRHFYRALLQRILLDKGVLAKGAAAAAPPPAVLADSVPATQAAEDQDVSDVETPLIVGSLRKSCFSSFKAYVHGALNRLSRHPTHGKLITKLQSDLSDQAITEYEVKYAYAKKNLSIIWTLMAFSAGVVESIIVVDRWLYLKQQDCVKEAWVQPLFDYQQSPRNLCVVAVKKFEEDQDKVEAKGERP